MTLRIHITTLYNRQYFVSIINYSAFAYSTCILVLFATIPQMREIYLATIETIDAYKLFIALLTVGVLCFKIYMWSFTWAQDRIDRAYSQHGDPLIDRKLAALRNTFAMFCSCLPMLGLSLGFYELFVHVQQVDTLLVRAAQILPSALQYALPPRESPPFQSMTIGALCLMMFSATFLVLARIGLGWGIVKSIYTIGSILSILVVMGPIIYPETSVTISKTIGPLATAALILTVPLYILDFLRFVERIYRIRFGNFFAILILGSSIFATIRLLASPVSPAHIEHSGVLASQQSDKSLATTFNEWLSSRADLNDYRNLSKPYPVFIVAAQGGGIYAGATALEYLTQMQALCSSFSQHVFATTAVSGGAIGAAIFASTMSNSPQVSKSECDATRKPGVAAAHRAIMTDDHLSPVLAFLLADQMRSIKPLASIDTNPTFDRARALEESFNTSVRRALPRPKPLQNRSDKCGQEWIDTRTKYNNSWCPASTAPAFIPITTLSNRGFRIAFSPFPLANVGDGTLYSLVDFKHERRLNEVTVMTAATASARFPIILPPASFVFEQNETGAQSGRVELVDGGYADASAAKTAVDIYRALKQHLGSDPRVSLHLVLLTDLEPTPRVSTLVGTGPTGFFAQINAFSQVRAASANLPRFEEGENVMRVYLGNSLSLALGWVISRQSYDGIIFTLGSPALCGVQTSKSGEDGVDAIVAATLRNSCVKSNIISLLSPTSRPQ